MPSLSTTNIPVNEKTIEPQNATIADSSLSAAPQNSDRSDSPLPPVAERETINILMVDDRPENLMALEATLHALVKPKGEDPGYDVTLIRASSGREALKQLLSHDCAVILLDVQMPEMDGYEAASLIRQRDRSRHTPIIFLTAINTTDTHVSKGYSLGAVDYIFKPFDPDVLKAKVSVFLDLHRKSMEIQRMADYATAQAQLLRDANDELAKTNKLMGGLYTELEHNSQELSKERDFVETILDTAGSFIIIQDIEGKVLRINRAAEEISGFTQAEMKGQLPWEIVVLPEDRDKVFDAFQSVLHGKDLVRFDACLKTKDSIVRRLSLLNTPVLDVSKKIQYVITTGLDITERHAAEEQIRKLNEDLERRVIVRTEELSRTNVELEREIAERRKAEIALLQAKESAEQANSAKDQFLAVLSHELRTPLTPVLAIVQMLEEDKLLPSQFLTWIQTIGRNVQLEARLIDDLLDLTRIANGKLQLSMEELNAHELLKDVIEMCREDINRKKLKLDLKLEAEHSDLTGDPARLQQVFWNIIKNAIKFTGEEGDIKVLTSNPEDSIFQVEVTDTGIGIPPEHLGNIFNAFVQGDKMITRKFGGLGLGLAISRALVDSHRGTIEVVSAGTNQGATFRVKLQRMPVPEPNISSVTNSGELRSEEPSKTNTSQNKYLSNSNGPSENGAEKPSKKIIEKKMESADPDTSSEPVRILLVEDNSDTSNAMQILLERKGYKVLIAHSVSAAIEIVKTYPCNLIISDIGLPDGTGVEMLKKANAIRPTRAIAMSGFGMEKDIERSIKAGFSAHLVKPVNFEKLFQTMQSVLATSPVNA